MSKNIPHLFIHSSGAYVDKDMHPFDLLPTSTFSFQVFEDKAVHINKRCWAKYCLWSQSVQSNNPMWYKSFARKSLPEFTWNVVTPHYLDNRAYMQLCLSKVFAIFLLSVSGHLGTRQLQYPSDCGPLISFWLLSLVSVIKVAFFAETFSFSVISQWPRSHCKVIILFLLIKCW